jgi:hypothetical protein
MTLAPRIGLVAVLVITGCSFDAERSAREDVEGLGGVVTRDPQGFVTAVDYRGNTRDDRMDMLRPEHRVNSYTIASLRTLKHLESVRVSGLLFDDDDLDTLVTVAPGIKKLGLAKTNVTRAGLNSLGRLPNLSELEIWGCVFLEARDLADLRKALPRVKFTPDS